MFNKAAAFAIVIVSAFLTASCSQQGVPNALKNERIMAAFDDRRLLSLFDVELNQTLFLEEDDFSVTIDGTKISGGALKPTVQHMKDGSRVYTFSSAPYSIKVVYELKPGRRFISKQLFITHDEGKSFHVNEMEVFRCSFKAQISSGVLAATTYPRLTCKYYGAFMRYGDSLGAFMLVQNPFLDWRTDNKFASFVYSPEMDWRKEYGPFPSDRGCIGTYRPTGRRLPLKMVEEWAYVDDPKVFSADDGMDEAEVEAYTDCVRSFMLYAPEKSAKIHVPWCENDFQIDVAGDKGKEEFQRIVDAASELGCTHVFYSVANTKTATREEAADDWDWEHLLWLNMGPKIRRNEWDPKKSPIPDHIKEFVDYAGSKGVKLTAYVYPSVPFRQNPEWLVADAPMHKKPANASLGVRAFQDWMIENLTAFYKRTGIGGYSFDYAFLWYDGTSYYAQWWGWRRVLEELRKRNPDIVIDGRQMYQCYGPWTWLAGNYPHPTGADEQPESFNSFPDLHIDRVSANRQRYTAWWYRNREFCPIELMPGFITHQTPRIGDDAKLVLTPFRLRDWDLLGWKYSLLSSIATAPFNHVVGMIPARDADEYRNFSAEDKAFFRTWLEWTDKNADILRRTKTILGQPGIGKVDGTAAIADDHGYVFLFNPNHRQMDAEFVLDASIGLTKGTRFLVEEIHPIKGKLIGKPQKGEWSYGDKVAIPMDGATAVVLRIAPPEAESDRPALFNAPGDAAIEKDTLMLTDVLGEIGTKREIMVLCPQGESINSVSVNGSKVDFERFDNIVSTKIAFAGEYFPQCRQVGEYDPKFSGGRLSLSFTVPGRIFNQLAERKRRRPIPYTDEDLRSVWLAPHRLLLYVQIAEPTDDMEVRLKIDGEDVEIRKAYTSITSASLKKTRYNPFVGFYRDVSELEPDVVHNLELELPRLRPGQFQGVFFENVESEWTKDIVVE